MTRRAAVICLTLIALALVASSAQAESAPATSKGKKGGKSVCSIVHNCALHTDAEHAQFKVALAAQLQGPQDDDKAFKKEVFGHLSSDYTIGSDGICRTISNGATGGDPAFLNYSHCSRPQDSRFLSVDVACPPADDGKVGAVIELLCRAYLVHGGKPGAQPPAQPLPIFLQGVTRGASQGVSTAYCSVEITDAMANFLTVRVDTQVTCSRFQVGPPKPPPPP
jgi:hypothetical protein